MTTTLPKPRRTRAAVTEPPVQPETTGQLSDNDMYDRMVSAILDHRLPPGTKLVEDKLAAAFGVSRTRVRPVLVRLANEQVVTLTPNRGASITQPTPQEALEVFEARRLIEPTLVQAYMADATDDDIAQLGQLIRQEDEARLQGDMRRAIRLSGDFHLQIAEHAGHQTLGGILRELLVREGQQVDDPHRRQRVAHACASGRCVGMDEVGRGALAGPV